MKYWVYNNGEVPGSYEPRELARLPGFSAASMVCPAEGQAHERDWQRAGLFPDVIEALRLHDAVPPPLPPAAPAAAYVDGTVRGPEDILDASSHKLFRHVTELMKELENRREERSLTQSLQRSLVEVKNELQAARERIRFLDDRVSLIPAFEDRERRAQEQLERARGEVRAVEEKLAESERQNADLQLKTQEAAVARENAARAQNEALREQQSLRQLVEDLNRQLATKEATLAKSLALIRRLEQELGQILPAATAGIQAEIPRPYDERAAATPAVEPPPAPAPAAEAKPPAIPANEDDPVDPTADAFFTPVPAPWQAALREMAAFLKRRLPRGREEAPPPPPA